MLLMLLDMIGYVHSQCDKTLVMICKVKLDHSQCVKTDT